MGSEMCIRDRPKRGFTNIFRKDYAEVNLGRIQAAVDSGRLDAKQPVDADALIAAGIIGKAKDGVRLLAKGSLKAKLEVHAAGASKAAVGAVEAAGGSVVLAAQPAAE